MHDGLAQQAFALLPHGGIGGLAVILAMFLAGLAGGGTHCAGMCGPFVLAQTTARLEAVPAAGMSEFHRLAGAALLPYHLGRLTTYTALGAVAGAAGRSIRMIPGLDWVAAGWLLLAAAMFLVYGLSGARRAGDGDSRWGAAVGRIARPLFSRPTGMRGYALGMTLGFLPCGLLYAALAVSAGSGGEIWTGAWGGGVAMAAFALGTMPGLVVTGFLGHMAAGRWRSVATTVAPALMLANAGMLGFAAWRLIGPAA